MPLALLLDTVLVRRERLWLARTYHPCLEKYKKGKRQEKEKYKTRSSKDRGEKTWRAKVRAVHCRHRKKKGKNGAGSPLLGPMRRPADYNRTHIYSFIYIYI